MIGLVAAGAGVDSITDVTVSLRLRGAFVLAAAATLDLCWSLVPPLADWRPPNEDDFSYVPVFYTTIVCLPAALYLLAGAISGQGLAATRARKALVAAAAMTARVAAFLTAQYVVKPTTARLFGIRIGLVHDPQSIR
jgi:hypothetical protein